MMAFDRTSDTPGLEQATVEALRTALARSVVEGNHVDDLRELLCRAAGEARSKGILAEQLLVILKAIWYSLPRVASAPSPAAENMLLQQLISRCIHEYYSPR
jgi:hypothetical protein